MYHGLQALTTMDGFLRPEDWTYTKKREAQEIIKGLWLGPWGSAREAEVLAQQGITHVVVVRGPEEARIIRPKFPERFSYEVVELKDNNYQGIIRFLPPLKKHVDAVRAQGGAVLIHGNAGMSRSAALVVGVLMQHWNLSCDLALQYVLTRRHCISITEGFKNQLREFEMLMRANNVILMQLPPGTEIAPPSHPNQRKRPVGGEDSPQPGPNTMDADELPPLVVPDVAPISTSGPPPGYQHQRRSRAHTGGNRPQAGSGGGTAADPFPCHPPSSGHLQQQAAMAAGAVGAFGAQLPAPGLVFPPAAPGAVPGAAYGAPGTVYVAGADNTMMD